MDKTIDFLKSKINDFVSKFNFSKIKYEYKKDSFVHFIEVSPRYIYDTEYFLEWECEVYKKFSEFNHSENICFTNENSVVELENPIYTKEGCYYGLFSINDSNVCMNTEILKPNIRISKIDSISPITDREIEEYNDLNCNIGEQNFALAA